MPPRLPTLSTSLVCHYYSKDFTELPMPQWDKGQCNLYSMSEHVHDIVRCLVIACGEACGLLSMTLRLSAAAQQSAVRPQSVGAGAVVCCENPSRQQPPSSVTFLSNFVTPCVTFCHILSHFVTCCHMCHMLSHVVTFCRFCRIFRWHELSSSLPSSMSPLLRP